MEYKWQWLGRARHLNAFITKDLLRAKPEMSRDVNKSSRQYHISCEILNVTSLEYVHQNNINDVVKFWLCHLNSMRCSIFHAFSNYYIIVIEVNSSLLLSLLPPPPLSELLLPSFCLPEAQCLRLFQFSNVLFI